MDATPIDETIDPLDPDSVSDQASFFAFVRALIADRCAAVVSERENPRSPYGPDAGGWESTSIEGFLEAALAWAEDSEMGTTQGLPHEPSWRTFAAFLYCGKIYE